MAAVGIATRPAGARVILQSEDGIPVVTEYKLGRGRVIFSADPIELRGDPRYQKYAGKFYGALLKTLQLEGEHLEPEDAPVHCFRIPSQDERQIVVLVNHDVENPVEGISVQAADGAVKVTLQPRMSGIVVSMPGKGVLAVESSGNAFDGQQLLLGTDLHMMAISFDTQSLL
ncbi:MAG: hypothetical protein ABI158_11485, partial [Edaphobacter sp.]